jgi:hypothetical protein
VPVRAERHVTLDELGAAIWRGCDGVRRVEDLVDAFAAEHRLTFHEARVAVTNYLSQLIRRGVLVIALPEDSAA